MVKLFKWAVSWKKYHLLVKTVRKYIFKTISQTHLAVLPLRLSLLPAAPPPSHCIVTPSWIEVSATSHSRAVEGCLYSIYVCVCVCVCVVLTTELRFVPSRSERAADVKAQCHSLSQSAGLWIFNRLMMSCWPSSPVFYIFEHVLVSSVICCSDTNVLVSVLAMFW